MKIGKACPFCMPLNYYKRSAKTIKQSAIPWDSEECANCLLIVGPNEMPMSE